MFGWLASFGTCERTRTLAPGPRLRRVSAQRLASLLPPLGIVLHLSGRGAPLPASTRLMAGQHRLAPLLGTCWLHAASTVTVDGPREWIDCIDARGAVTGRFYLLPDTDYLAWDALLAEGRTAAGSPSPVQRFAATQARLLRFTQRPLAFLSLLDGSAPSRLSALGLRLAREIAHDEGVLLPAIAVVG